MLALAVRRQSALAARGEGGISSSSATARSVHPPTAPARTLNALTCSEVTALARAAITSSSSALLRARLAELAESLSSYRRCRARTAVVASLSAHPSPGSHGMSVVIRPSPSCLRPHPSPFLKVSPARKSQSRTRASSALRARSAGVSVHTDVSRFVTSILLNWRDRSVSPAGVPQHATHAKALCAHVVGALRAAPRRDCPNVPYRSHRNRAASASIRHVCWWRQHWPSRCRPPHTHTHARTQPLCPRTV